jgi:hypothetical protein
VAIVTATTVVAILVVVLLLRNGGSQRREIDLEPFDRLLLAGDVLVYSSDSSIQSLDLSKCRGLLLSRVRVNKDLLEKISKSQIEALSVTGGTSIRDLIAVAARMPSLKVLRIIDTSLYNSAIAPLSDSGIEYFSLITSEMDAECLKTIGAMRQLKVLRAGGPKLDRSLGDFERAHPAIKVIPLDWD